MSFTEFANQNYAPSLGSVVITNNTDYSIDGSSKKIVWSNGLNETCTITFDSVTLSNYEEISFYLDQADFISEGNVFKITVGGIDYNFERLNRGWNHVLIDCSGIGATTTIIITSLVTNLTLFLDVLGYRKVNYDCDIDIIEALKNHISLDYNVSTTLSASVTAGATSISLTSQTYINDTSRLEIDNGVGTTEEVELINKSGKLLNAITNSFTSGDTVTVLCPTLSQSYDSAEPDPICGIVAYDKQSVKENYIETVRDGYIHKFYTGALGILIYIDCTSDKKLFQLSREFDFKYGEMFQFLLDGELIDITLENVVYSGAIVGNNPRVAYYYNIDPQPIKDAANVAIDTINLTVESEEV
jgi:hypothetical protein